MFQRINVLALQTLTIYATSGTAEIFRAMASSFAQGVARLQHLRLVRVPKSEAADVVNGLDVFLLSFSGLRSFRLHCDDCDLVDVDGIVNHGETLKVLSLVVGGIHRKEADKCFDAVDLQQIATACTALEQLCLNLYEIDTDRLESDVLGSLPGVPPVYNEFEEALSAISSIPKLRILRLTNAPNYRQVYHRSGELMHSFLRSLQRGEQRYAFKARADGVMQYLAEHGSKIQFLAFSPMEHLKKADNPDKHGHSWPDYYYYRGRLTDHKGADIAVARPLANWQEEFPDANVLGEV
ncbi:hypothetical protein EK21DRAFT_104045 [Setomelanomma holmii]|uniref:Uncharacterized protein n=1 Tax=Setomelanomma holmii TaxID=210430 RepID=A0A9P4H005_9PLEO|nr:hypothetical protein EK21DRAFT_104045 [Setomelanomma holmii]